MTERIGLTKAIPLNRENIVLAILDSPPIDKGIHFGTMQEDGRTIKTITGRKVLVDAAIGVRIGGKVITYKI